MHKYSIGIDIGASKVAGAIIDDQYTAHHLLWQPTQTASADALLQQVDDMVEELERKFDGEDFDDILPVGIGLCGTIDWPNHRLTFAPNLPILKSIDLQALLVRYKQRSVFIDNDAHCALLAEITAGVAVNDKIALLLALGTGLGGAIAINGQLFRGSSGGAGEFGQLSADWHDYSRSHGTRGTFEQLLSGKAIERQFGTDAKAFFDPENKDSRNISKWCDSLSALITTLNQAFNPDAVIIAGSIAESATVFLPKLNLPPTTLVKQAKFGKTAGVVGAGILAWQQNTSLDDSTVKAG